MCNYERVCCELPLYISKPEILGLLDVFLSSSVAY